MKKLLVILMTFVLCIGLFGCAETGGNVQNSTPESHSVTITETGKNVESTKAGETATATKAVENTTATEVAEATKPVHTHKWRDATCSAPKTCTECGATSGLTAGHSFSDGKCISCGRADPDYVQVTMVWIPTKGGTKYHSSKNCSGMDYPDQVTKSQAEQLGFAPCKKCYK